MDGYEEKPDTYGPDQRGRRKTVENALIFKSDRIAGVKSEIKHRK